jgi:hypothetical protein
MNLLAVPSLTTGRPQAHATPQTPPDAGIASYFIWLRRHTGLSIHCTAAMLHTETEVIHALEAGAVSDLPAWPETVRIVTAYAALGQVDANAPLSALHAKWPAHHPTTQPSGRPTAASRAAATDEATRAKRVRTSIARRNANRLSLRLW